MLLRMVELRPTRQPWGMLFLGALSGWIFTAWFSTDVFCTSFGGALLGAAATWPVQWLLDRPFWYPRRFPPRLRALFTVIVGLIAGLCLRVSDEDAFARAFGIAPPPGVHDIAFRKTIGGSGDVTILLRFRAERAAFNQLLSARPLAANPVPLEEYARDGNWNRLVHTAFSGIGDTLGGRAWKDIEPMGAPQMYEWEEHEGNVPTQLRVLWDAQTGEAYAMYLRG
jgi:hypothetical protein